MPRLGHKPTRTLPGCSVSLCSKTKAKRLTLNEVPCCQVERLSDKKLFLHLWTSVIHLLFPEHAVGTGLHQSACCSAFIHCTSTTEDRVLCIAKDAHSARLLHETAFYRFSVSGLSSHLSVIFGQGYIQIRYFNLFHSVTARYFSLNGSNLPNQLWAEMMTAEISNSDQPTETAMPNSPDGLILSPSLHHSSFAVLIPQHLAWFKPV